MSRYITVKGRRWRVEAKGYSHYADSRNNMAVLFVDDKSGEQRSSRLLADSFPAATDDQIKASFSESVRQESN